MSGTTDKSGLYGVDMTDDMFHVGKTGIGYDKQCNNNRCITTFKGFVQQNQNGAIVPDAFNDPVNLNIEIIGGTPYNYNTYNWQVTYPDNFTKKK